MISKLVEYATENGVKLSFLAKKLGVHPVTLSRWVHGSRTIGKQSQEKIKNYIKEVTHGQKKII